VSEFAVPNLALARFLDWLIRLNTGTVETLVLRLYTNDFTPGRASVTGDFTEASFPGYSQRVLNRGDFSAAALSLNTARITLAAGPLSWTPGASGQVVYGAYVVGSGSTLLYAARRFATPRTMASGVDFRVLPAFTLETPALS